MTTAKENRPLGEADGSQETNFVGIPSLPHFTPEMAASRAQGVLMVLVHNPQNGRVRRRLFFALEAADRCAERARERGQTAHIVLGRFHAVEVV